MRRAYSDYDADALNRPARINRELDENDSMRYRVAMKMLQQQMGREKPFTIREGLVAQLHALWDQMGVPTEPSELEEKIEELRAR